MRITRRNPNGFEIRLRRPPYGLHELASSGRGASPVATGLPAENPSVSSLPNGQRPRSPVTGCEPNELISAYGL